MGSRLENIVKTFVFSIAIVVLMGVFPHLIATREGHEALVRAGAFRWMGLLFILPGTAGYLACFRSFILVAESSPIPGDPQRELIVTGLYRHVRNPLYLSALLVLFGQAILYRSLDVVYYLLAWAVFFNLYLVFIEEPALQERFGRDYTSYCRAVSRWVPSLKPYSRSGDNPVDP